MSDATGPARDVPAVIPDLFDEFAAVFAETPVDANPEQSRIREQGRSWDDPSPFYHPDDDDLLENIARSQVDAARVPRPPDRSSVGSTRSTPSLSLTDVPFAERYPADIPEVPRCRWIIDFNLQAVSIWTQRDKRDVVAISMPGGSSWMENAQCFLRLYTWGLNAGRFSHGDIAAAICLSHVEREAGQAWKHIANLRNTCHPARPAGTKTRFIVHHDGSPMRTSSNGTPPEPTAHDHWILIEAAGTFAALDIRRFKKLAHAEVPYSSSPLRPVTGKVSIEQVGSPMNLSHELRSMLDNHWRYIALTLSDAEGEQAEVSPILLKQLVDDLMVPETSPEGHAFNAIQPICPFKVDGPEGELLMSVDITEVPRNIFESLARKVDGIWYIRLGVTIGNKNVALLLGLVELYTNQLFVYCLSVYITITSVCRFVATYNKLGGDPESFFEPDECEHQEKDSNHVCHVCRTPKPCTEVRKIEGRMYCQSCLDATVAHLKSELIAEMKARNPKLFLALQRRFIDTRRTISDLKKAGKALPAGRLQPADFEATFRRLVQGRRDGDDDLLNPLRIPEAEADGMLTTGLGRRLPLSTTMTADGLRLSLDDSSNWRVSISGLIGLAKGHADPIALCLADNVGLIASVEREHVSFLSTREAPIPAVMTTPEGSRSVRNWAIIRHVTNLAKVIPYNRETRLLHSNIQQVHWFQQQCEGAVKTKMQDLPNSTFNPPPEDSIQPIDIKETTVLRILQNNIDYRPDGEASPDVLRLNGFLDAFKVQEGCEDVLMIEGSDRLYLVFAAEPAADWNRNVARREFEARIETLKKYCNKKYRRVKYLNWEILYLIAGMDYIRHRGGCEGTGLPLLFFSYYHASQPNLASLGKRRHGHSMQSGMRTLQPATLADYNDEECNMTFESARWNQGKSNWKLPEINSFRSHLGLFYRLGREPPGTTIPMPGDNESEARAPIRSFFDPSVSGMMFGFDMITARRGATTAAYQQQLPSVLDSGRPPRRRVQSYSDGGPEELVRFLRAAIDEQVRRLRNEAQAARDSAARERAARDGAAHLRAGTPVSPQELRVMADNVAFKVPERVEQLLVGYVLRPLKLRELWELSDATPSRDEDAWVSDKTVTAYINTLSKDDNDGVALLPPLGNADVPDGEESLLIPTVVTPALLKKPRLILGAVQGHSHWITVCADINNRIVEVYDSDVDDETRPPAQDWPAIQELVRVLEEEVQGPEPFRFQYHFSPRQSNGYDCGIWALYNIQQRLSVGHPLTKEDHGQWIRPGMSARWRRALLLARLKGEKAVCETGNHISPMDMS